jgi:hypothetical protein
MIHNFRVANFLINIFNYGFNMYTIAYVTGYANKVSVHIYFENGKLKLKISIIF